MKFAKGGLAKLMSAAPNFGIASHAPLFEQIRALVLSVSTFTNLERDAIKLRQLFLDKILAIQCDPLLANDERVQEITTSLENQLFWNSKPGTPITVEEKELILRECDSLRLQACVRYLDRARSEMSSRGKTRGHASRMSVMIFRTPNGITHGVSRDSALLFLPFMQATEQADQVAEELANIYQLTQGSMNWIVDCSLVETFSPQLVYALCELKALLLRAGKCLDLFWVGSGCSPEESANVLIRSFSLELAGKFYFTPNHLQASLFNTSAPRESVSIDAAKEMRK